MRRAGGCPTAPSSARPGTGHSQPRSGAPPHLPVCLKWPVTASACPRREPEGRRAVCREACVAWGLVWVWVLGVVCSCFPARPASGSVPSASLTRLYNKTSGKWSTRRRPLPALREPPGRPGLPESGAQGRLCQESAQCHLGASGQVLPAVGPPPGVCRGRGASLAPESPLQRWKTRAQTLGVLATVGKLSMGAGPHRE